MRKFLTTIVIVIAIFIATFIANTAYATSQIGILGKLYETGHPDTGEDGHIEDMTSWKQFLYVSWRDLDGDQYLDVWNVRNPSQPRYVRSYSYGNILDDQEELIPTAFLRGPRDMTVIDGHLIFWSEFKLMTFRPNADGTLTFLNQQEFDDDRNRNLNRPSFQGNYATIKRTMLTNRELLDVIGDGGDGAEELLKKAFVNFTNPLAPYFMQETRDIGLNLFVDSEDINVQLNSMPAIVNIDNDSFTATLKTYSHELQDHVNDFWGSKLSYIFNANILNLSITEILENVLGEINFTAVQNQIITAFTNHVDLPEGITLRNLILSEYAGDVRLEDVFEDYDIKLSDGLEVALEKYIEASIEAQFDAEISKSQYVNLLRQWRNSIFNLDDVSTIANLKAELIASMNFEIDEIAAAEYFVDRIVSPLLGNPDYLTWRMRDLVANVTDNAVAGTIDNALEFVDGTLDRVQVIRDAAFAPINTIIRIAEWTSGQNFNIDSSLISPPACFQSPDSTEALLNLVLYERGAQLNPNGLAFFEMIKLGQYFSGNDDYLDFDFDTDAMMRNAHANLANSMFASLFGSIDPELLGGNNLDQLFDKYADALSLKKVISKTVAQSFIQHLKLKGVNVNLSLESTLNSYDLYINPITIPAGQSRATVNDLINLLESLELANTTVVSVLDFAKEVTETPLKTAYKDALNHLDNEIFGSLNGNSKLEDLLANYISDHVNGGQILGSLLTDVMGNILSTQGSGESIVGWMSTIERARRGDCMAQWNVALDGITAALTVLQNFDPSATLANLNIATISINQTTKFMYDRAVRYVVSEMVNELVAGIIQESASSYASWYSRLDRTVQNIDLADLASFQPRFSDAYGWKNKLNIVMRNVNWFGATRDTNGEIALLSFDPGNVNETLREIDLGRWTSLYKTHQSGQFLFLGGSKIIDGRRRSTAMIVDLENPTKTYQVHGSQVLFLTAAEKMVSVNGGQTLAVYSNSGDVFLLPRPSGDLEITELVLENDEEDDDSDAAAGDSDDSSGDAGDMMSSGSNMNSGASGGCSLTTNSPTTGFAYLLILLLPLFWLRKKSL